MSTKAIIMQMLFMLVHHQFAQKTKPMHARQADAFYSGRSAPDFAAEDYEVNFEGRATVDDLTELGRRQLHIA